MKLQNVQIQTQGALLSALRYLPEGDMRPVALLFTHGFTSGKHSMDSLASYLAGKGFEGLTFDFVGHKLGGSGGELRSMEEAAENLHDTLKWLRANSNAERIVLVGHSMGAAAALRVAANESKTLNQDPEAPLTQPIAGIACICIGIDPFKGFEGEIGKAMLKQRSDYVAGASAETLLYELNVMVFSAREIGAIPALFIAAKQDVLVSAERVEALAALASNSVVVRIDSSHLEGPDRSRPALFQWLNQL